MYLRGSARISRIDRIRHEAEKYWNEERHITGNRRGAIETVWGRSCEWRTAEFLRGLQNGTHRGKEYEEDQSTRGRMGLGTASKSETPRMNILIESSGGRKFFGLKKTVYLQKNSFNNNENTKCSRP
jgi:hypothetical protein